MIRMTLTSLGILLLFTFSALAAPTCHCFQQRSFDDATPKTVEPYLLATTSNSLMAVSFGIPKRAIVQAKMAGTPDADLWLAYALASATSLSSEDLMQRKERCGTWSRLASESPSLIAQAPAGLRNDMTAGLSDEQLADRTVAWTLLRLFAIPEETTATLLHRGLSRQEVIVAVMLALLKETTPESVAGDHRPGPGKWGLIAKSLRVPVNEMESVWQMLMARQKKGTP